jgi:hypothetical protein
MFRALSLTCLALLMVAAGSRAAMAKDTIAVLGLEVVDPNGTPTVQDTQVAKDLTEGLRARAKAGTGPYQLAAGSDKELADVKLLNSCDEGTACMAAIGNQMGAAVLMYGKLEKQKGAYQVTMKLLDVRRKALEKSSTDIIPLSQASNSAELQGWAKKIYGKLTGETSTGNVAVKLKNGDHGTILINGEEKGSITSGSGQVSGLAEGKYKLAVESEGYHRYEQDITVTAGQTTNVPVDLEKSGEGQVVQQPPPPPPPGGPEEQQSHLWRNVAIGGGAATIGLGAGFAIYWSKLSSTGKYPGGGVFDYGYKCTTTNGMLSGNFPDECKSGSTDKTMTYVFGITSVVALGVTAIALVKTVTSHNDSSTEHAERGHRVRKPEIVVTPVVSPTGGGATLQFDW